MFQNEVSGNHSEFYLTCRKISYVCEKNSNITCVYFVSEENAEISCTDK